MDFLVNAIADLCITGIIVIISGLCLGLHFTLPQVFGIWLVLKLIGFNVKTVSK